MKNVICSHKNELVSKPGRPKKQQFKIVRWRPKSQKARDKFFEIGGSRWLDRIMEGLTK